MKPTRRKPPAIPADPRHREFLLALAKVVADALTRDARQAPSPASEAERSKVGHERHGHLVTVS